MEGRQGARRWVWELRSVNGKGLDIRVKLQPGYEFVETGVRDRLTGRLGRGNIQASLAVSEEGGAGRTRINQAVLGDVVAALASLRAAVPDAQPPTLDGILALRGVMEAIDESADEPARQALGAAVLADLDAAIDALTRDRRREGIAIGAVLSERLDAIERTVRAAEASPARTPEAIRARIAALVGELVGASPALDPDRLHQEAVMIATRADIREEIDRLLAHTEAARGLLADEAPVGRRLDFLAQEFNREANTLCAKANDRTLTALGLELKALVDQFREQVQNLE